MTSKSGYSSTLLRRKASAAIIYLARLLILIIVGYIVLYPFFYMLVTAIKDTDAMLDVEHIWIPVTYSLKSFKDIFELLDFGTALKANLPCSNFKRGDRNLRMRLRCIRLCEI